MARGRSPAQPRVGEPRVGGPRAGKPGMRALRRTRAIRPSWRALTSLLIGVLSIALAYGLGRREHLVVACFALLLPLLGLLFVRLRRPKLELSRRFSPPVVAVGDVVRVTLRVSNIGAAPSTPLVWDDALPWFEPSAATRELPPVAVGSAGARTVAYDLHPPRRGLYAVGPFAAEHEDPFGMATSTVAIGAPDRLVVVPAVSSLEGGPSLVDGEGEARLVQRRVLGRDDDLTTREYRVGDALRRVHWRASAKHGELMVRQEEHRSHPDARIVVDTRRRGYPDAESDTGMSWSAEWSSDAFEWVVRMTASLGLHLESAGFRVAIEETSRAQIVAIGDRGQRRRAEGFLSSLAGVQLLDGALDELPVLPPADGSGPLFAVLGDPEGATVDWLVARRRGGESGYAFLVSPRPSVVRRLRAAGWAVATATDVDEPGDVWRAAASETGLVRGSR